MLTDDRFGHDLGVALRQEVQDVRADPDLVGTLRRRQTRRTWTIRTAIAVPVAAAAAAVLVVTTAGHDAPLAPAPAPTQAAGPATTTTQVRIENVAYVRDETLKALSQATQYVIFAKSTYRGGYSDTWTDKATQRYRNDVYTSNAPESHIPNGKLTAPPAQGYPIHLTQSHAVSGPDGNQTIVTVDYDQKAWFTSHDTNKYPSTEPIITDADSVRRAITDGTLELLGHETVDGIDTLHLRLYGPKREYRIDMWVDGKTYLPVQEIAAKSTGPNQFPDSAAVTEHYTWLPRTPENLAKLTLTPPPGFQRLK